MPTCHSADGCPALLCRVHVPAQDSFGSCLCQSILQNIDDTGFGLRESQLLRLWTVIDITDRYANARLRENSGKGSVRHPLGTLLCALHKLCFTA